MASCEQYLISSVNRDYDSPYMPASVEQHSTEGVWSPVRQTAQYRGVAFNVLIWVLHLYRRSMSP